MKPIAREGKNALRLGRTGERTGKMSFPQNRNDFERRSPQSLEPLRLNGGGKGGGGERSDKGAVVEK